LQDGGLVKRAPKRSAYRRRRPRRPLPGMMLFQDGSSHAWLAGRPPLDLIVTLDDATSALVARLAVRIGGGLPPPCQVVIEAGIVPPERADSWYEADLAVTCAGLSGRQFVAEPVLIVEVLSPSPAATDRDRKLPDYRRIGSLEDILVVSSTEPRIERFRREEGGWRVQDYAGSGTVSLEAFGITLELGELYAGVLAPAT
jgi:hypothetical protein